MLARGSTTICLVRRWKGVVDQTFQTSTQRSSLNSSLEMEASKRFLPRLLVLKWEAWAVDGAVEVPILSSRCSLKRWVGVEVAQEAQECSKWDLECSCLLEVPWVEWAEGVAEVAAFPPFNSSPQVPNKDERHHNKCSEKMTEKKRRRLKKCLLTPMT